MRKPVMAGNWKMNKTRDEALQFIYTVTEKDALPSIDKVDSIICAPAIILRDLVKRQGDFLRIGAQNMHFAESGAYTGEISPSMLTTTCVEYVIIGHSERRAMFAETDETVNLKVKAAVANGLKPIVCCGESLVERENGTTHDVLTTQIEAALKDISEEDLASVIIAYEPIWAIGTGKVASAEMADEACGFIRSLVEKLYSVVAAEKIRILYGGSVSTKSVDELMAQPNIDGGLVGGASLNAESFIELCKAAAKTA